MFGSLVPIGKKLFGVRLLKTSYQRIYSACTAFYNIYLTVSMTSSSIKSVIYFVLVMLIKSLES